MECAAFSGAFADFALIRRFAPPSPSKGKAAAAVRNCLIQRRFEGKIGKNKKLNRKDSHSRGKPSPSRGKVARSDG